MASSSKKTFQKPSLSLKEQLSQLENRGMQIDDDSNAMLSLAHLNYYRLGAYWLPFEKNHDNHQFNKGTHIDDVLNLYVFDREFRLFLMDAIERLEVSVRTQFAFCLSQEYGAHVHLKPEIFHDLILYSRSLSNLERDVKRSKERFIKHLLAKYSEALPAIWAVVELMSLGQLSMWYENINKRSDRKRIADCYNVDEKILTSFLRHLTYLRNLCAHHSRVWNRNCTITPSLPGNRPSNLNVNFNKTKSVERKIYNSLVMLIHFMDITCPGHHFRARLKTLIEKHKIVTANMGFPENWETLPIWLASDLKNKLEQRKE
ncbi:MAG: DNA-binding protein [Gammaproteobacteria bacterium]|nr:MAG: DNA-binding protein [Gammaproteobacteria bacterium]